MPNFTGVIARPRLMHRALRVPRRDLAAPLAIGRGLFEPLQQRLQDVVLHRHLVVRHVAIVDAV
jgi:hypothetical protein